MLQQPGMHRGIESAAKPRRRAMVRSGVRSKGTARVDLVGRRGRTMASHGRRWWVVAFCFVLLAGCGSSGDPQASTSDGRSAEDGQARADGISIEHQYGTTTIEGTPERVVTLIDDEFVVALGVVPVGMSRNPFSEDGISDPVRPLLDGAEPELLDVSGGIPYEQVALIEPDLILGGVTAEDYEELTAIAPTLPYVGSSNTDSWQERSLVVGRALRMEDAARELVSEVEAKVAEAATSLRKAEGATFTISVVFEPGQVSTIRRPEEASVQLLEGLGLTLAEGVGQLPDFGDGRASLGLEQVEAIDADLILVGAFSNHLLGSLEDSPVFASLTGVKGGGYLPLETQTLLSLSRPSPVTVPLLLDELVPRIGGALDG